MVEIDNYLRERSGHGQRSLGVHQILSIVFVNCQLSGGWWEIKV